MIAMLNKLKIKMKNTFFSRKAGFHHLLVKKKSSDDYNQLCRLFMLLKQTFNGK